MPQELTQEQKTKLNRALLLEKAGRLSKEQAEGLAELRAQGIAPAPLQRDIPAQQEMVTGPRGLPHPRDIQLEEALPAAGGALGAAIGTPGGPAGAITGATIGGAGGEAARQLINRVRGEKAPATGSDAFDDIMLEGGAQGAIEGVTRGAAGLFRMSRSFLANRVLARDAGKALAEELAAGKISPKQFGDELHATFDTAKENAGTALRTYTDDLAKANPNLNIPFNKSLETVNRRIRQLQADMRKFPNRGSIDPTTGKNTRDIALAELQDLQKHFTSQNFLGKGNVQEAVGERSRAFQLSQVAKGELEGMEAELSKALHEDIGAGLKKGGKLKEFQEFEKRSSAFREVAELGEPEKHKVLAAVFGDKRVDSEKIGDLLVNAPEDAIAAVRILRADGGEQSLAPVRKAVFLKMLESKGPSGELVGKLLTDDAKIREIFGATQAKKIQAFAKAVEAAEINKAGGGSVRRAISFATFGIPLIGQSPLRIGINDSAGLVLEIPAKRLAQFLDNPQVFEEFTKAMSKEPSGTTAAKLIRVLQGAAAATGNDSARTKPIARMRDLIPPLQASELERQFSQQ